MEMSTKFKYHILLDYILTFLKTVHYMRKNNKCTKKLVILQLIKIIVIKSKETKVVTYTCRYFSGHLIHSYMTE